MNSHLKSVGNIFRYLTLLALPLVFTACSSSPKEGEPATATELASEVSIKSDRAYLDKERENIPAEIKKTNDELAYDLEQMAVVKDDPNVVRSKFQDKVRKGRDKFRIKLQKNREAFSKNERKLRDGFLKDQAKVREEFKKDKPNRERNQEFFAEQDLKRKEHFQTAQEKRAEFEAESRDQSKEFDESMRERIKQFNDQLRIYTQRYNEQKRSEKAAAQVPQARPSGGAVQDPNSYIPAKAKQYDMREFEDMKKVPGTPVGSDPTEQ